MITPKQEIIILVPKTGKCYLIELSSNCIHNTNFKLLSGVLTIKSYYEQTIKKVYELL